METRATQEDGRWLIWDGAAWQNSDFRLQVGVGDTYGGSAGTAEWRYVPDQEVWVERKYNYDWVRVEGPVPERYPRTYTGPDGVFPSGIMRTDGQGNIFPIWHGWHEDPLIPGTAKFGLQHGLFWLPPLDSAFVCEKVLLTWTQNHAPVPYGTTPFGYHTLSGPPMTLDYADPRLDIHKFHVQFVAGQSRVFELPGFEDIVNANRSGGFGVIVGSQHDEPVFAGYGQPVAVRYLWSQDIFSGWIK